MHVRRSRIVAVVAAGLVGLALAVAVPSVGVAGTVRSALHFDGVDDIAIVKDAPMLNPTTAMTLEFWVRFDAIPHGQWGVTKDDGRANRQFALGLTTHTVGYVPRFRAHIGTTAGYAYFDGGTVVTAGVWYHVAQTYDGSLLSLYVNGQVDGQMYVNAPMVTYPVPLTFGNNPEVVYALGGTLDEIRLWNVARTPAQIQASMSKVVKPKTAGLIGYWRLDEGKGDVARDRSGYGQTARLGTSVGKDVANPSWTRVAAPIS